MQHLKQKILEKEGLKKVGVKSKKNETRQVEALRRTAQTIRVRGSPLLKQHQTLAKRESVFQDYYFKQLPVGFEAKHERRVINSKLTEGQQKQYFLKKHEEASEQRERIWTKEQKSSENQERSQLQSKEGDQSEPNKEKELAS